MIPYLHDYLKFNYGHMTDLRYPGTDSYMV